MPDGKSQDADSAKDEIPEVIASMHSEEEENEAEEDEEEEEEEEEEGVAPPSRPHQLVRPRKTSSHSLPNRPTL